MPLSFGCFSSLSFGFIGGFRLTASFNLSCFTLLNHVNHIATDMRLTTFFRQLHLMLALTKTCFLLFGCFIDTVRARFAFDIGGALHIILSNWHAASKTLLVVAFL